MDAARNSVKSLQVMASDTLSWIEQATLLREHQFLIFIKIIK